MTVEELKEHCQKQIRIVGESADVAVVMRGTFGKTGYKRLLGVKGECVQELMGGEVIVMFPAKDLLEAVERAEKDDN